MLEQETVLSRNEGRGTLAKALLIVAGLICAVSLARWIDARRPVPDATMEEEQLYLTGNTARRISLGFSGLAADWYWMRSLQYVGLKVLNFPKNVQLDDLGQLNLKLLAPLLDTATTLDPAFMEPYEYAAVVLPAVNLQEAIRITRKGIAANPQAWRLYQHLGYIYWQQHDFQAASESYGRGASLAGAPAWMEAMKARMVAEGGSRSTARQIYSRMYEQAGDNRVKEMARLRLMQLDSLDERDVLQQLLAAFKSRTGRCAASWREMEGALHSLRVNLDSSGVPLDPAGTPYALIKDGCEVDLGPLSEVPAK